jgi:Holliday junction resolvase RusA-like endonuclease
MTAAPLTFTVPGQPVAKARARTVVNRGRVHSFTPAKTANYENLVRMAFVEKYPNHVPIEGPIQAVVFAYFQMPKCFRAKDGSRPEDISHTKRPDGDNIAKSIFDAGNGVIWRDDSQISDLAVIKRYSANPRVEISIQQLAPAVAGRE